MVLGGAWVEVSRGLVNVCGIGAMALVWLGRAGCCYWRLAALGWEGELCCSSRGAAFMALRAVLEKSQCGSCI